jgi:hypothetical protein
MPERLAEDEVVTEEEVEVFNPFEVATSLRSVDPPE